MATDYSQKIWTYLLEKIGNKYGVAGLMGNLQAESGLHPDRVQGDIPYSSYSQEYTAKVDSGAISKNDFIHNGPGGGGYGLAQWTFYTRKQALYEKWKSGGYSSIGSIDLALDYLWYELQNRFPGVLSVLKSATSVRAASDKVLHDFENPEDQSESVEKERAAMGETWYKKYADSSATVDYTPRTNSDGIEGDFHYYSKNPFYTAGYGLPNCTCYAYGRFWEIADPNDTAENKPSLSLGNAGEWYPYTADGYERSKTTPKLGAVICWAKANDNGHVAIVEKIAENGDITCSNSAWNGTFFYTTTHTAADGYAKAGYDFQGFIYNPYVTSSSGGGTNPDPDPEPEPDPEPYIGTKRKGYNWVLFNPQKRRMMKNGIYKR